MLWGFGFAAQSQVSSLPVFGIGAVIHLLSGIILFLGVGFFDKISGSGRVFISKKGIDITKKELVGGILCGLFLSAASAFQRVGLSLGAPAGKAGFITALYIIIVPMISLALGGRAPANVWIGVALAVFGFYLLCIKGDFSVAPSDLMLLLCAIGFSLHIIVVDRVSCQCDGVRISSVQFLTSGCVNLLLALVLDGGFDVVLLFSRPLPLLYLVLFSTALGYTLQIIAQREVSPGVASVIMSLESVFGVLGGAVVLGEVLLPREYIGCAVVFAAVIIAQLDFKTILSKLKITKQE